VDSVATVPRLLRDRVHPLLSLPPLQSSNRSSRPAARTRRASPTGFRASFAISDRESTLRQRSHRCLCSAPGVSHTLDGLLLPVPCRLVSSGYHVRGFLFRGFPRWQARRAFTRLCPRVGCRRSPAGELPRPLQLPPPRLQGLDPAIDSVIPPGGFSTRWDPHPLLRFRSFRVSPLTAGPPSRAFRS
jgi:hypothetical protein